MVPREATRLSPSVAQVRSCFPTYCRAARMADILDIINASPDIFDNWTRHLRCIANADQCQAVSVTVFEASRSPQAFRDAFVCFELPEVGAKIVCQPEHREAICRYLIEHDVQVRKPRYIIVADEFVEMMVRGVISTIRRKEKLI